MYWQCYQFYRMFFVIANCTGTSTELMSCANHECVCTIIHQTNQPNFQKLYTGGLDNKHSKVYLLDQQHFTGLTIQRIFIRLCTGVKGTMRISSQCPQHQCITFSAYPFFLSHYATYPAPVHWLFSYGNFVKFSTESKKFKQ